ncbi:NAD(P)-binding protein [Aspergillus varians]
MVKIAIAGGSSNVGQEIIDVLVAAKKHDILILSRKDAPAEATPGITWVKTDYEDTQQLAQILQGVHTVLSFITEQETPASPIQKRLIDAAVQAGVKRLAPSEWAASSLNHLSWYAYKGTTRQYLADLNKDKKVLEYALFQPGLFTNYLTQPYKSAKHILPIEAPIDFNKRRAILAEGAENSRITLTTVQDFAQVVARAIDYEGEWPATSGVQGTTLSIAELIALGEKIRGGRFSIERVRPADFEDGTWETSWVPRIDHPSIPTEQTEFFSRIGVVGLSLAFLEGEWSVSDEWNRLLPGYVFTQAGEFLEEAWRGKD